MSHEQIPEYISNHVRPIVDEYCKVFDLLSIHVYWRHPHELTDEEYLELNTQLATLWGKLFVERMSEML